MALLIIAILAVLNLTFVYKVNNWARDIKNYEKRIQKQIHFSK